MHYGVCELDWLHLRLSYLLKHTVFYLVNYSSRNEAAFIHSPCNMTPVKIKSTSKCNDKPGAWGCCNTGYPSETHPKPKYREMMFVITSSSVVQSFWNRTQGTTVSLTCPVDNSRAIWQLQNMFKASDILRDLGLRRVSQKHPNF